MPTETFETMRINRSVGREAANAQNPASGLALVARTQEDLWFHLRDVELLARLRASTKFKH